MSRRILMVALLAVLAFAAACTNKKVNNPLANVGSKQPDKVLFDRAMDAMKHNRFDVSRLSLQTLINTYPDSEYIARAKLAIADSWYAEGGSAALQQAEVEYKDFITFFPNMPEAAEAQLKIANIHYQEMEKPDRDYAHALHAEEEYRNLIMQFPDSKLVPEAKQRLREVQEVLAEREFRVGRFYYLRQSYPAAIARLKSLVAQYPLYSKADEALYLLGQSYEGEVELIRGSKMTEAVKARYIQDFTKGAAEAYSRIITRYPVMDRAADAKDRLIALHQPVPRPTKTAIAQNKAEEDSRHETSMVGKLMGNFNRHPSVAEATKVGEPTLVDPQETSAREVVQGLDRELQPKSIAPGKNSVAIETVNEGAPPPNQAAPHSDSAGASATGADATGAATDNSATDSNELKPNVPASNSTDSNELTPNVPDSSGAALPPPAQVNQIQGGDQSAPPAATGGDANSASSSSDQTSDPSAMASSKKKKKKGLKKIIPF